MSTRNSPEDLDTTILDSRPIIPDIEKTDPLHDRLKSSTIYLRKSKEHMLNPQRDDERVIWDSRKGKIVEENDISEPLYEEPDNASPLPANGEAGEEKRGNKKGKIDSYALALILMEIHTFVTIDDILHCYDSRQGFWRCIPEKESKDALRKMIPQEHRPMVTGLTISESYHWIKTECPVISNDTLYERKDYINYANGVFSLNTQSLLPHNPDYYFQNVLQVDCPGTKNAQGSFYEDFLSNTFGNDKDTIRCFEEFLGLALSSVRDSKQAFFLYGPSNTGKSVILNVLKRILGIEFTSSLSFSQLGNEFAVAQLVGKWLNISGEMSGVANKRLDLFKSLVGNDLVTACFKCKDHFQFRNQALLVFACNNFPEISPELVEAFASRILIFPFLNVVPRDKWIPDLSEKLFSERNVIISHAIKGLIRLRRRNYEFIETAAMCRCKEAFLGEANSFILFAKNHLQEDTDGQCTSEIIRQKYWDFCKKHELEILADNVWSRLLQQSFSAKKGNITSGPEIEKNHSKYNARGYKGIRLIGLEELE